MTPQAIENRVDGLERRVTELERLPERVTALESQIVQLRTGMHDEFSAVRAEMRSLQDQVVERFVAVEKKLEERIQETSIHMRVLHGDVIGRLAAIQEGQSPNRPRRGTKPKKE